ncbi:unnamed protein product [Candida verbasci]|uniref:Bem3p n=1 Tax=Candida verbasci TaxID=1227364 RepID=A0A9W4U189_9ASCO|nr:unnamed protein product [Candida verbasci]
MTTPSDPKFDRSRLSDNEFVEQLIFENRELKAQINNLNKIVDNFNNLKNGDIKLNGDDNISASEKIQNLQKKSSKESNENNNSSMSPQDIPMRSARRRKNSLDSKTLVKQASTSSLQSSILTYEEEIESSILSKNDKDTTVKNKSNFENTMESINSATLDPTNSNTDAINSSSSKLNTSTSSIASKIRVKPPQFQQDSKMSSLPSIPSNLDNEIPKTPDGLSAFGVKFENASSSTEPTTSLDLPYTLQATSTNNSNTNLTPRPQFHTPNTSSNHINVVSSPQTPGSSFTILHTPKTEMDESTLFIKPEEFHTISISIVSTISTANQTSKDPNITMKINDRETNKEMWKIRKTYTQLISFDNEIRPIIEYFGLTILPDKQLFLSTTPTKIENRRSKLQNYFNSIFLMPHIPHMVLYKICKFLSLNFVNPLDDYQSGARKEGFLVRKYKGLGSSWKIRWCQVDGPNLEIYENPGGILLEQIRLKRSQIGRQSTDSVAEDKGYRHAFLIMESQKSSKLHSSTPKHFFCAETDEERDDWVTALIEFTEVSVDSEESSPIVDNNKDQFLTPSSRYESDELESISRKFMYNETPTPTTINNDPMSMKPSSSLDTEQQAKKMKKRSIFPFRRDNVNEEQPIQQRENQPPPPPQQQQQPIPQPQDDMQLYFNQLNLDNNLAKCTFGREIEVAFDLSHHDYLGKQIPSICYRCLDFLNKTGAIFEEGIFRLSGSASLIRQLKDQFNTQFDIDFFKSPLKPDIHTISGLFKTYLRELPSPIIGAQANNHLNSVMSSNSNLSPSVIATIFRDYFNLNNVDKIHYDLSYIIFQFLRQIISQNQINRMNLRNVCIVFVPTLNISLEVLSTFLVDFECIFENGTPISDTNREVLDLHIPNF